MSFARDVEIAIREHDYTRATQIIHANLSTPGTGENLRRAEMVILLRPSVAVAAAIVNDPSAVDLLERAAIEFNAQNQSDGTLAAKATSNRRTFAMTQWVEEQTNLHERVSVDELVERGRASGYSTGVKQALKMLERHGVLHVEDEAVYRGPAPQTTRSVPAFKEYFATVSSMDSGQTAFYHDIFRPSFLEGRYVDLEGNLSYAFALLGEAVSCSDFDDLDRLRELFHRAASFYPDTSLARHATAWAADTHFLQGAHQAGYDVLASSTRVDIETYIGIVDVLVDSRIPGAMAWDWANAGVLTPYGKQHKQEILAEIERILDEEHSQRGRSIVADLWQSLTDEHHTDDAPPAWVRELLDESMPVEEIQRTLKIMKLYGGRGREAFRGLVASRTSRLKSITWPSTGAAGLKTYSAYGFGSLVEAYLTMAFREAENRVREGQGIARVGEGWVSEVELFYRLREAFPETRVIHQGRPKWLGRQSIDIFLPDYNVAVEYQGEQHHRPVSIFGGKEGFIAVQERDARKRQLCEDNNVALIEVLPGYVLTDVIDEIRLARPA